MTNNNYELTVIQEENDATRIWVTDKVTFGRVDGTNVVEFASSPDGNMITLLNTGCITILNSKGYVVYTRDL